jgi:hypothetical protein
MRAALSLSDSDSSWAMASTSFWMLPPSTMSVPRPAMLVAMVIAPGRPAWAITSASRACCLAFSTLCGRPALVNSADRCSLASIEVVPTSTGWPRSWQARMSLITAMVALGRGAVDLVVLVLADHRAVGRDDHGFQAVDALEFEGFGVRGAGHARQLLVHAEVVLEGDRGERLVFLLDRHAFLGLHRLVQAVRPAPPAHQAAGEFVDDDDFIVLHHVMLILEEQRMRAQRGIHVVHQHDVGGVVEAAAGAEAHLGEDRLDLLVPGFRQQHLMRDFSSTE